MRPVMSHIADCFGAIDHDRVEALYFCDVPSATSLLTPSRPGTKTESFSLLQPTLCNRL